MKIFIILCICTFSLWAISSDEKKPSLKDQVQDAQKKNRELKKEANLLQKLDKLKEQNRELELAKACEQKDGNSCLELGNTFFAKKNMGKAETYWEKGCKFKNNNACYQLGTYQLKRRKMKEAANMLGKGCDGKHAECCNSLAYLYFKQKKMGLVEKYFKQACDLKLAEGCANLGEFYFKKNDTAKAIPYLDQACQKNNTKACSQKESATLAYSVESCEKNNVALSCFNAGHLFLQKGNADQAAIRFFTLGCKLGDVLSCGIWGGIHKQEKQFQPAVDHFLKACTNKDASACYFLSLLYSVKGHNKEAAQALRDSFALGFKKWEEVKNIRELQPLRESSDYNALQKEFKELN